MPQRPCFRHRTTALLSLFVLTLPQFASAAMDQERRIDDDAQQSLAVTIYNDDLALVKDRRLIALEAGENRLAWRNVAVEIRPQTALVSDPAGQLPIQLIEQNFDFDLLTPQSLLRKYVGRQVEIVRTTDSGRRTRETAQVLAVNDGVVLRYADRIETEVVGHLTFPDVPSDLRDRPTLVIHLHSEQAGETELELSYLTGGLSWTADYVANLSLDGTAMDLNGWVTLTNASGVAYRQARLQLVAGEINRVQEDHPRHDLMMRGMVMAAAAPMEQEALDEYHLYSLPRLTDILNHQTKQVALLSAPAIPVTRILEVRGQAAEYRTRTSSGWVKRPVTSTLGFVNRDGSLGVPLPRGIIRVYARDSAGNAQFIGEDRIDHTPKHAEINLRLGESFDITARRKQTDFRKLGGTSAYDYAFEAAFEMELANARAEPVNVRVIEQIHGDWRIGESSHPHIKEAADLARWDVQVPAEGTLSLTWRAQIRH